MKLFALVFVLADISITVKTWSCVSPIRKVYSRVNTDAVLQFNADVTNLNSPRYFEVKFSDGSSKGRIVYNTRVDITIQATHDVSINADSDGNVDVTLNNVQQHISGMYIMTSAGFPTKCNCLYILGRPSKPNITLKQTPFVGQNAILTCDSASNTIPRNHSLTLHYTWTVDGTKDTSDPRFSFKSNNKEMTIKQIVKADKNMRLSCSATEYSSFNYSSPVSDDYSFDVYYGPDVVKISVESPYYLREGERNKQIRCTSDCYPNCTFHWTHQQRDAPAGTGGLLTFQTVNRSVAGEYKCTARNTATTLTEFSKSVNVHIIVQYPPTVTIRSSTETIREGQDLALYCEGDGVPAKNEYNNLTQTLNNVNIPNNNSAVNGLDRHSSIQFSPLLFQDTGTYTCTMNNGIKNEQGYLYQTGSKEIIVEASPKILTDELRFTGSSQGIGRVKIPIYSYPDVKQVKLSRPDGKDIPSNEFDVSEGIVKSSFYGKEVSLNGSVLNFEIRNLKQDDFGNYSLGLSNDVGSTVRIISLIAEGRPSSPTSFQYLPGKSTPSFLWRKNFNGGLVQSFIIQISINGTNIWTNATNILETDEKYQINGSYFSTEVHGLKPGRYTARLISKNSKGESDIIELGRTFEVFRQTENQKPIAAIVGGSIGAVVVLIGVVVVVMILKAKNKGGRKTKYSQNAEHEQEEVNTVNPMYVSADEDTTYAQPIKKKKVAHEESNLYSEVTKKKGHGKKRKQNMPEERVENPKKDKSTSKKLVNKDGLIYADLAFDDKNMGQKKANFRNIDSMTEYVEVDFSKKADPLPDIDDEIHMANK